MCKNRLRLGLLILMVLLYLHAGSQSIVHEKLFGSADLDAAYDIKVLADGGYLIVGNKGSVPGSGFGLGDIYLIRTNADGDTLWTKTYGNKYDENANAVAVLPDGSFVITGFESGNYGASNRNVLIMKMDNNGNRVWKKTYGGSADDEGNEIKRLADGGFVIAGLTESYGAGGRDAYLIRINATGDTLWTRTFGKEKFDDSWDVELAPDGGFVLTGGSYSYATGGFDDAWLIKTDANGNKQWIKNFGVADKVDWAWALTGIRSGGYAFVGVKNTAESGMEGVYGDLHFVKVDNNGNKVWDKSVHGDYRMEGMDIQQTKDNGFIIGGFKLSQQGQFFYLVKTNANGDVLWDKTIGSTGLGRANAVAETATGDFVAVGFRSQDFNATSEDIYFVKVRNGLASSVDPGANRTNLNDVLVYPNPAKDMLQLSSVATLQGLCIYDATGCLRLSRQAHEFANAGIDMSELANGLYFVVLKGMSGSVTRRIVISR